MPFHARDRFVGGSGPAGHHGARSLWLVHEQSPGGNELHHNRHNDIYRRVRISIRYPTETSFHTISHYFILKRDSNHTSSYCFILFHKWTVISEISILFIPFHSHFILFHIVSYSFIPFHTHTSSYHLIPRMRNYEIFIPGMKWYILFHTKTLIFVR